VYLHWQVDICDEFLEEFHLLFETVQDELVVQSRFLRMLGPKLSRPHADTLNGSRHTNMKELRFNADRGVWRVAFAFDRRRRAILLVGADKSGISESRFYKGLIKLADARFDRHLANLKEEKQ
jgi:hypothetical protein